MSSNHGRDFRSVVRVDDTGEWSGLVEADNHDLSVLPSPDGSRLLIVRHADGGDELAIHASDGQWINDVALPGRGVATAVWSPDSALLAVGVNTPTSPGDVFLVDAASGTTRTLVDGTEQMSPELKEQLTEPTSVRIPTRDGESIPCFVYSPENAGDAFRTTDAGRAGVAARMGAVGLCRPYPISDPNLFAHRDHAICAGRTGDLDPTTVYGGNPRGVVRFEVRLVRDDGPLGGWAGGSR
jgi:hypothetical protein